MSSRILEVNDLVTRFHTQDGTVHAVNGVSFYLNEGDTLGIVGESGCGKSVTVLSILRLIPEPPAEVARGEALFDGQDLLRFSERELRKVRGGKIGLIFQDPMTSLNPVHTIGSQVSEVMREHLDISREQANRRVLELLDTVGIPDAAQRARDFPHQFSGGMRQRVMIAIALACNPRLLIADEPTTALDVTIQAQIIEQVKSLREQFGMTVIWITHDLGIVAGLANRVIVMYAGFVVEHAAVADLYADPRHPYTIGLLQSLPNLGEDEDERLVSIDGRPPDMLQEPSLCQFLPRCRYAIERCREELPILREVGDGHQVACWSDVRFEPQGQDL